jgi:predicted nucleic acid-binding protein
MKKIPDRSHVFLDTNILLYAVADHPRFGPWCNNLFDRVYRGDLTGYISGIVLNEFIHKLIIGEIAEKTGLRPIQVVQHLKNHREEFEKLEAYEIAEEVETAYGFIILGLATDIFRNARQLMKLHRLMSNDALHLAVMQKDNLQDLVTNDKDFDGIRGIRIWKPQEINLS